MQTSGLTALADSYALDRDTVQEMTGLCQRLFANLRAQMAPLLAVPIADVSDFALRMDSEAVAGQDGAGLGVDLQLGGRWSGFFGVKEEAARLLLDAVLPGSAPESGERPFTPMEVRLLIDTVGGAFVRALNQTFAPLMAGGAVMGAAEMRSGMAEAATMAAGDRRVMVACASLKVGEGAGAVFVVLPVDLGFGVAGRLAAATVDRPRGRNQAVAASALRQARFEFEAVLPNLFIPLGTLLSLRAGSVLPLCQREGRSLRMELRHRGYPVFSGTVVEDLGRRKFLIEKKEFDNGDAAAGGEIQR